MIFEGVKLTLLGMTVVFSFLILLIAVIKLSAELLKGVTAKEAAAEPTTRRKSLKSHEDDGKLTVIISAAVAAHRARYGEKVRGKR